MALLLHITTHITAVGRVLARDEAPPARPLLVRRLTHAHQQVAPLVLEAMDTTVAQLLVEDMDTQAVLLLLEAMDITELSTTMISRILSTLMDHLLPHLLDLPTPRLLDLPTLQPMDPLSLVQV